MTFAQRILMGISDKYLGTNYLDMEASATAFERQKYLDAQDRAWQEYMQDKMNVYSSPEQQMARLRAAGLNPSLVYGNPISEAANPPGTSSSSAPRGEGGRGTGDAVQSMLNMGLVKAQIDDIKASARLKNEQAITEDQLRESRYRNLEAATKNLFKQNGDIESKIQQRIKQNELTDAEIHDIHFEQMFKSGQLEIDKERLGNETRMTDAEIAKLEADTRLALAKAGVTEREYREMIWTYAIRKAGLEAQVGLTKAQIAQADATARKLHLESDLIAGDAAFERTLTNEAFNEGKFSSLALYGVQRAIGMFGHILKL